MPNLSARRLAVCVSLLMGLAQAASAREILIMDAQSQPESLTVAPGGILFVGSASTPFVYKVRPGSTTAEKFVDASAEGPGTFFFGMLADAATNTLWTCQLTPLPGTTPVQRHTTLRGFDLTTGAQKLRWNLPGDNSTCNNLGLLTYRQEEFRRDDGQKCDDDDTIPSGNVSTSMDGARNAQRFAL
jgi:hypothetical protein